MANQREEKDKGEPQTGLAMPVLPWLHSCVGTASSRFRSLDTTLLLGLAVYILFMLFLALNAPYFILTQDDLPRSQHAFQWLSQPTLLLPPSGVWLPLQSIIGGVIVWFTHETYLTILLLNISAGVLTLVFVFRVTRLVFGRGALWAVLVLGLTPWFAYLSLSHMSEPLFFAALAAFMFYWTRWSMQTRPTDFFLASVALLGGAMERYHAWALVPLFFGYFFLAFLLPKTRLRSQQMPFPPHVPRPVLSAIAGLLPVCFIVYYVVENLHRFGEMLYAPTIIKQYYLINFGTLPPLSQRLLIMPRYLVEISPFILGAAVVGFILSHRKRGAWLLATIATTFVAMSLYGDARGLIGGTYPVRHAVQVMVPLAPLAGFALSATTKFLSKAAPSTYRPLLVAILTAGIFLVPLSQAAHARYRAEPHPFFQPAYEAAAWLRNQDNKPFEEVLLLENKPGQFSDTMTHYLFMMMLDYHYPVRIVSSSEWAAPRASVAVFAMLEDELPVEGTVVFQNKRFKLAYVSREGYKK